jgi:hypothetical protein
MILSSKDDPLQTAFGHSKWCKDMSKLIKAEEIKQSEYKASDSMPVKVCDKRPWVSALILE